MFSSHGFQQLIDIPTRVTSTTTSLIDLIFVNDPENIKKFGTLPKIADHDGVFVSFHYTKSKQNLTKKIFYDYKNTDEEGLIKFINNYEYEKKVFSKPVENQTELFTQILIEALDKFVPKREILIKPSDQPWQNSYTRLLMRKKNKNYQIYKKINSLFLAASSKNNVEVELVTRLRTKMDKALKKCKISDRESTNANRRTKQAFF